VRASPYSIPVVSEPFTQQVTPAWQVASRPHLPRAGAVSFVRSTFVSVSVPFCCTVSAGAEGGRPAAVGRQVKSSLAKPSQAKPREPSHTVLYQAQPSKPSQGASLCPLSSTLPPPSPHANRSSRSVASVARLSMLQVLFASTVHMSGTTYQAR